jgi:hypothetical protein
MSIRNYSILCFTALLSLFGFSCFSQDSLVVDTTQIQMQFQWQQLAEGMDYCETKAPKKSIINDSKLSILKVDPSKVDFLMLSATEFDKKSRSAVQWADSFTLNVVINAGMYDLANVLKSKGFLKNYNHLNNASVHPTYNSLLAFNPKDSTAPKFEIIDLTCNPWDNVKTKYQCMAQGMRMIDCNGSPMGWNKRNQSCSMLVCAMNEEGLIFFVFSRSPYTHNEMIQFLLDFPFSIRSTIYLEGGPETSFYVQVGEHKIEKMGSYISNSYANDDNDHFWPLPNVIGIRAKQ